MEHQLNTIQVKNARAASWRTFYVNPLDPDNSYPSIETAIAVANAMPADVGAKIVLAANQTHSIAALVTLEDRDYIFQGSNPKPGNYTTMIDGAGSFGCTADLALRYVNFIDVDVDVYFDLASNWTLEGVRSTFNHTIRMTHGAAGCSITAVGCTFDVVQEPVFQDLDIGDAIINCTGCVFSASPRNDAGIPFWFLGGAYLALSDCRLYIAGRVYAENTALFKLDAAQAGFISLVNVSMEIDVLEYGSALFQFAQNPDSSGFIFSDCRIDILSEIAFDFNASNMVYIYSAPEINMLPDNLWGYLDDCPVGTLLRDQPSNSCYVFDGVLWRNGEIAVFDASIEIGVAAIQTKDIGFNGAAGDWVLSASISIPDDGGLLPDASGAVKLGLGTAGDPDKYALTPTLAFNAHHEATVAALARLAGAEDFLLVACDAAGAHGAETVRGVAPAGGLNGLVRVRIAMIRAIQLPGV